MPAIIHDNSRHSIANEKYVIALYIEIIYTYDACASRHINQMKYKYEIFHAEQSTRYCRSKMLDNTLIFSIIEHESVRVL